MIEDEQIVAAIDKLISGMRDVSDDLSPAERERMIASIRLISPEVADQLEGPFRPQSLRRCDEH